jgi:hypothetical protein
MLRRKRRIPFKLDRQLDHDDRIFETLIVSHGHDMHKLRVACVEAGLDVEDVVRRRAMRFD